MKKLTAAVATVGLVLCGIGFFQLQAITRYFIGDKPEAWGPTLVGVGACLFALGRTWMIATWHRADHANAEQAHSATAV